MMSQSWLTGLLVLNLPVTFFSSGSFSGFEGSRSHFLIHVLGSVGLLCK